MRCLSAVALFAALSTTLDAQPSRILFGSYFGGRDFEYGNAVALGPGGDIWFAGTTLSTNLPVRNASQVACGGGAGSACQDGFLVRLSSDGKTVRWATYFGGPGNDAIIALAVDGRGYAYVAGHWGNAALGARFDPDGRPLWRAVLGEGPETRANAVAYDDDGSLYLTGQTSSTNYPTIAAPFPNAGPASCNGLPVDAFLTKVSHDGQVMYSTYIPGNGNDYGTAIAVDALGRVFVGGGTSSTDLPLPGAIQSRYGGRPAAGDPCDPGDAFVLQFAPDGSRVVFGTLLGGGGNDEIASIFAGTNGLVTVVGPTSSGSSFPVVAPAPAAGRSFVTQIDPSGPALVSSRIIGPQAGHATMSTTGFLAGGVGALFSLRMADWQVRDLGGIGAFVQSAVPVSGSTVIAVGSASAFQDFFRPANAFQPASGGLNDAYIGAFQREPAVIEAVALNAGSFYGPEMAPDSIATAFYTGVTAASVEVNDQQCRIIAAAAGQVSFLIPSTLSAGAATLTVRDAAGAGIAPGALRIHPAAPGVFTANSDGRGAPAGQVILTRNDGTQLQQEPFACSGDGACEAASIDASDESTQSVLVLYGTGLRHAQKVRAYVAGQEVPVDYAGAQPAYEGLDQINVRLPKTLKGLGEARVVLSADGRLSNPVQLQIR